MVLCSLRSVWNLWDISTSKLTLVSQNPSEGISYKIDQGLPLLSFSCNKCFGRLHFSALSHWSLEINILLGGHTSVLGELGLCILKFKGQGKYLRIYSKAHNQDLPQIALVLLLSYSFLLSPFYPFPFCHLQNDMGSPGCLRGPMQC